MSDVELGNCSLGKKKILNLLRLFTLITYILFRVPVIVLPPIPQDLSDDLIQWFDESQDVFSLLRELVVTSYSDRLQRLLAMPKKAGDIIWWPFTQHKFVPEEKITVIDSRCGENFAVFKVCFT